MDDDEDYGETVRDILQLQGGYQVETARSGFAAGIAVATLRPDALLLDIRMPGMDGLEVAEQLRAARSGRPLPVIACTAYTDRDVKGRLEREFVAFLTKPVDLDLLLRTLERVLI